MNDLQRTEPEHPTIGGYRIDAVLAETERGRTLIGVRDDERFILKELRLARVPDWKGVELFEREAETLCRLSHPGIPNYLEHFSIEDDGFRFYTVRDFVEGESLAALCETADGPILDEEALRTFLADLLDILDYLHNLNPPVIHRNRPPKPSKLHATRIGGREDTDVTASASS